jgi:hypothetical protein
MTHFAIRCQKCAQAQGCSKKGSQLLCSCSLNGDPYFEVWWRFPCHHLAWKRFEEGDNPSNFCFILDCKDWSKDVFQHIDDQSAVKKIMQNLYHLPNIPQFFKEICVEHGYCEAMQERMDRRNKEMESLETFFGCLKGLKEVYLDPPGAPFADWAWTCTNPAGETGALHAFVWVTQWAVAAIKHATYIELDASFFGTSPYCYCVIQVIICNTSIPIALGIGPTEKELLFTLLYDALVKAGVDLAKLLLLPVLSDEGAAIGAFCHNWPKSKGGQELVHFHCHRHLIEKFGSGTPLALLVRDVLFCPSQEIWLAMVPGLKLDVQSLLDRKDITEDQAKKFWEFVGYPGGEVTNCAPDCPDILWNRADRRVSTCSNHAERFHRSVNARIHGNFGPQKRLEAIRDLMDERYEAYKKCPRRQVKKQLKDLSKSGAEKREVCRDPLCRAWSDIYSKRFGLPKFPCPHTVRDEDLKMDFPLLPTLDKTAVNQLNWFSVRTCDRNVEFEGWGKSDDPLESVSEDMVDLPRTNLDKTVKGFLRQLVRDVRWMRRHRKLAVLNKMKFKRALSEAWDEEVAGTEGSKPVSEESQSAFKTKWWKEGLLHIYGTLAFAPRKKSAKRGCSTPVGMSLRHEDGLGEVVDEAGGGNANHEDGRGEVVDEAGGGEPDHEGEKPPEDGRDAGQNRIVGLRWEKGQCYVEHKDEDGNIFLGSPVGQKEAMRLVECLSRPSTDSVPSEGD